MQEELIYFSYRRKSTDDKNRQQLSLPYQKRQLRRIAADNRLNVYQTLEEKDSATYPGRKVFGWMLDELQRTNDLKIPGRPNSILVPSLDRLYRNEVDDGRVRWMLRRGVIKSVRTAERDYRPCDAGLLMAVDGSRGAEEIKATRTRMRLALEEKLFSGKWPGHAPLGYIYSKAAKNIVPHRKKCLIALGAFERYGRGDIGYDGLAQWLFERGIKTRCGTPWAKRSVLTFLTNKLYIGIMRWAAKVYDGKYETFVSIELFKRVGEIIDQRSKRRPNSRNKHGFAYLKVHHCVCGSMITAQLSRGKTGLRYRHYRCAGSHGKCRQPYLLESSLTEQSIALLAPLRLSSDQVKAAYAYIDTLVDAEEDEVSEVVPES